MHGAPRHGTPTENARQMTEHVEVLWVATAALTVTAVLVTALGLRRSPQRGWRWWLAAMWAAAAGAALAAWPGAGWQAAAEVLLLQWPLLTLVGVRRFHGRRALPGGQRSDLLLLAVAAAASAVSALQRGGTPPDALALLPVATAWTLVHAVAATRLAGAAWDGGGGFAGSSGWPLRALSTVMLLASLAGPAGVVAALAGTAAGSTDSGIEWRAAAAALALLATGFVALVMVAERRERQLREAHRRLHHLANVDALTGVPNRRHFLALAERALLRDRPGSSALLMFDVDHFKLINDGLGHAAGDRALQLVAASVQAQLREHDIAGRHGGDEFALLLRGTGVGAAGAVAARIVERLQGDAAAAGLPRLSLSFGLVQPRAGEPVEDALRRADQALYEAKRQGRSCAVAAVGDEDRPVFSESQRLGLTGC